MHQFIETRRKTDHRKVVRCTICQQEWTAIPRIHCPGVPVKPWSQEHGMLRTRTQAKKEHYLLPDDAQPVAALRLDGDPWYIWLYDVSECERRLPTAQQVRKTELREQTIRERYGCRLCTKRYLKRDATYHVNGVCEECRQRVRQWNHLIQWARSLLLDPPPLLVLFTEPERRPIRVVGGSSYQLTGYQHHDLATGELIAEGLLRRSEDWAFICFWLDNAQLAGVKKPVFLLTAVGDQDILGRTLRKMGRNIAWRDLTTTLPGYQEIPSGDDWAAFPSDALEQSRYYAALCQILGLEVSPDASVASMLRQIVSHLGSREKITL